MTAGFLVVFRKIDINFPDSAFGCNAFLAQTVYSVVYCEEAICF